MTVLEVYQELKQPKYHLSTASIYELLTFLTGQNYDWLINHQETEMTNHQEYEKILMQLQDDYPVAYITKTKNFFGLDFYVNPDVLIPRPETEILIENALAWLKTHPQAKILDLGTGAGILGLTLKKYYPETQVLLSDVSLTALKIAQKNAQIHQLNVDYLHSNFLTAILKTQEKFDLIICNPPYIDCKDPDLDAKTRFEPILALFAPDAGLKYYKEIFQNLMLIVQDQKSFCCLLEFGWKQRPAIEKLAQQYLDFQVCAIKFQKDYSQHWRCIIINSVN